MLPSPSDSASMSEVQVSVVLTPINVDADVTLVRSFTLSASEPTVEIGRCSKRGLKNRTPAKDNAWFDSRVMSRDHAELSIGLDTKNVYICDYGSTHGTWINSSKLITGEKMPLIYGDVLTFGVPVDREDETYPALAVKCKFEWIDEYEHDYVYFSRIQTDWRLRWPTSDEVPVKSNVLEPITPPASKLRPFSTSTNTFCVPEDDSDVEEVSFPKPICVIEDDEGSVQGTVHKGRQMNEDPKTSGDPESYYVKRYREDEAFNTQSDNSANSSDEEDSELEESDSSSLVNGKDGANAKSSDREEAGDYAYDQFSEEDSECEWEPSDSNALSGNESSVGHDSYDDEKPYINSNAFVDPSVLLREKLREDAFISSVSPSLPVKPEATDPKSSIPMASASFHEGYSSFPGSYQPPHTFLPPPIPAYDVNPWRMPQNFAASSHTPYPRFEYEDGPFSCKNGPVYPRNRIDSNPSTPLREPSPVKEFSPDVASVSLKRKASEMEAQDAQKPEMVVPVSQPDLNGLPKAEVVDAISSALSEGEPSSKRVKSSHSPSKAMAGYTATAVISALLGGLGTIALLAALPAEYFQ